MYQDFYAFSENPFGVTPDTRFFYLSPQHQEVIDTFLYGIRARRGFMLLTGEVGAGKTTSLRALLNRLEAERGGTAYETSLVINPLLSTVDLIKAICQDFGIETAPGDSVQDQIAALNTFLLRHSREDKNAVVIIDEAQDLSPEALEMVRLLSNLETETHKLLQIILAGQPELESKLALQEFRQIRQRVQIRHRLRPLSFEETKSYVLHRLRVASPRCCLVFQPAALKRIYSRTGGIPRLINHLCELALMAAYLEETHIITRKHVDTAFDEMGEPLPSKRFLGFFPWVRRPVESQKGLPA